MYIDCPQGWKSTTKKELKYATITVHRSKVQIYNGICDSCDLCQIKTCRFYDTSPEATRRFMRGQGYEHTLEALRERLRPH